MIISLIIYILINITFQIPIHKVTHTIHLEISVDNISKGNLTFGLFQNDAPRSVSELIQRCLCGQDEQEYKRNDVQYRQCEQNSGQITEILNGDRMIFSLGAKGEQQEQWASEINDYYTEFGAIGQRRDIDTGKVQALWTIFQRRMDFDGRNSQWLVFGGIMSENDRKLIGYINWTGNGDQHNMVLRDIRIERCHAIKKKSFNNTKQEDL